MPTPTEQLLSRTVYDTDGTTTVWDFSFANGYLDPSHVKAYTADSLGAQTPIVVTEPMLIGEFQLEITPALADNLVLTIYRDTPKDAPLVNFTDESGFSEIALDTNAKQAVMIAAEAIDTVNSSDIQGAIEAAETAATAAAAAAVSAASVSAAAITAAAEADAAEAAAIAAADSAASINPASFATAAQGTKADSALQLTSLTGAATKTPPVDADEFTFLDSVASFAIKKFTWANIKTALATVFALKGANSDITSLSGLTTALSIAQGGTGGATANAARTSLLQLPPVRQTVLNGPVDSDGFSAFGGATGSTTVTATGTLTATAANGVSGDYIGSITNPSWTSLSTDGTMYLYLDVAADGTCTTGSTTLEPTYRWGGADVTTNNQFTFNIQETVGKVGNGSVATQTYRVFVGEVTVAGAVVTAITWYQLQGRYTSAWTATLSGASTTVSYNHNVGDSRQFFIEAECTANDATRGYVVGDRLTSPAFTSYIGTYAYMHTAVTSTRLTAAFYMGPTPWNVCHKSAATYGALTAANWKYRIFSAPRGW